MKKNLDLIKQNTSKDSFEKLELLNNKHLYAFIAEFILLCNPEKIVVCSDCASDIDYIRKEALARQEEKKLKIEGQTVHFDGYYDQARDKENTKYLLPENTNLGQYINAVGKKEGLIEVKGLLKGIMKTHTLFIQFFCLGPANSEFSLPAVQLTDSAYVAHSQNILYRQGYQEFKKLNNSPHFFKFVHSQGELEGGVSKNIHNRRVYIDIQEDVVYSVNTQYGGNTIGHKKLAMRLAINKASEENWLTEHMFLMGINGPKDRVTYFTGAYPSLCGKTSTAMLPGEKIVGDDIVYMRIKEGKVRAVNVEKGMFGIIEGVNSKDDSILWEAFKRPGEVIYSNILIDRDNNPYWIGKDDDVPEEGINYSGKWSSDKTDAEGFAIPASHPNARFTIALNRLENVDSALEDPEGVEVGGIIYGGRDSNTWVPVEQSFDWIHGIITKGACLESETTAAALGKRGVRTFNPMANLAFVSISLGKYIENNINFGKSLNNPPVIFSSNYFLKDKEGVFLNSKEDKAVWLKWAELRVHNDVEAIKTPTGYIPLYNDLKSLFKKVLNKDYSKEDYLNQFTVRIPENLSKIERIKQIYETKVLDTPEILFEILSKQINELIQYQNQYGDYIKPDCLA